MLIPPRIEPGSRKLLIFIQGMKISRKLLIFPPCMKMFVMGGLDLMVP